MKLKLHIHKKYFSYITTKYDTRLTVIKSELNKIINNTLLSEIEFNYKINNYHKHVCVTIQNYKQLSVVIICQTFENTEIFIIGNISKISLNELTESVVFGWFNNNYYDYLDYCVGFQSYMLSLNNGKNIHKQFTIPLLNISEYRRILYLDKRDNISSKIYSNLSLNHKTKIMSNMINSNPARTHIFSWCLPIILYCEYKIYDINEIISLFCQLISTNKSSENWKWIFIDISHSQSFELKKSILSAMNLSYYERDLFNNKHLENSISIVKESIHKILFSNESKKYEGWLHYIKFCNKCNKCDEAHRKIHERIVNYNIDFIDSNYDIFL